MTRSIGTAEDPDWGSAAAYSGAILFLPETFDAFYLREFPHLVALAYGLSGSRTHAEDLAQEAMLTAYRRWESVGTYDRRDAWVRRVCANLAMSHLRRRAVEARALVRLRARRSETAELDADDSAFWSEVRRLPRRQAQVVALYYVYGCSVADVAATLGCAEGTVKSHLSRARQALDGRLTDEGTGSR